MATEDWFYRRVRRLARSPACRICSLLLFRLFAGNHFIHLDLANLCGGCSLLRHGRGSLQELLHPLFTHKGHGYNLESTAPKFALQSSEMKEGTVNNGGLQCSSERAGPSFQDQGL